VKGATAFVMPTGLQDQRRYRFRDHCVTGSDRSCSQLCAQSGLMTTHRTISITPPRARRPSPCARRSVPDPTPERTAARS
jgi:hypothetical protein